ncbi:hypothetical protein MMC25_005754 [Agyrium rufum]|nr:hypothetical protein [Agyrium rufum]
MVRSSAGVRKYKDTDDTQANTQDTQIAQAPESTTTTSESLRGFKVQSIIAKLMSSNFDAEDIINEIQTLTRNEQGIIQYALRTQVPRRYDAATAMHDDLLQGLCRSWLGMHCAGGSRESTVPIYQEELGRHADRSFSILQHHKQAMRATENVEKALGYEFPEEKCFNYTMERSFKPKDLMKELKSRQKQN